MARRTRQQWQSLIADFETSGLTQAEFCKQHDLNPKYFSLKRIKLSTKASADAPRFSQVLLERSKPADSAIELRVGRVTVKVTQSTPPTYLAQLIRSLA